MKLKTIIAVTIFSLTFFMACKKSSEEFVEQYPVSTFFNIKIGDSAFYRLDSLEFTVELQDPNILNSYLVKEIVSDTLRDNLNQKVWQITKYITKDTSGNGFWRYWGEYYITIKENQVDITENNLRFIKLKAPVRENFSWKGNSFLPGEPYPQYDFSIDNNMSSWDYTYLSVGKNEPAASGGSTYTNVCAVEQINQSSNINLVANNIINRDGFASREKSLEKYAPDTGLIYRELTLWEFQPTKGKIIGFISKMWRVNK